MAHTDAPGHERFPHVIRMRQIQNRVTQQHHQLLMLAFEKPGQRLFTRLNHNTITHPLPKLGLCCPKLSPVFAYHKRRLLLSLFLCAHLNTPRPLRVIDTQKPVGEASLARQHQIFKLLQTEFPAPDATIVLRNRRVFDSALLKELSGRSWVLS